MATFSKLNIGPVGSFISGGEFQLLDVSETRAVPKVLRGGVGVPPVALNATQAGLAIDNLVAVTPRFLPRVVSQSIPAGTKVPPGTAVDFVVVRKSDIPFNIFDAVHDSLVGKTLDHIDDLLEKPAVRQVLLKHESASDVTPAEKAVLVAEFQIKGITVDEAQPGKTFKLAFDTARQTLAFG